MEEVDELSPSVLTIAVAVNGSKNSKYALAWALEKFVPKRRVSFSLLYVRPKITLVPTPFGNYLPINDVRDDIALAYKEEIKWQTEMLLLPYKKMCAKRQVETKVVVIEAEDVSNAITKEVARCSMSKLVIGASSGNPFIRKFKGGKLSSRISGCISSLCTVYIISNGKLLFVRSSASGLDAISFASETDESIKDESDSEFTDTDGEANFCLPHAPTRPIQRNLAFSSREHKRSTSADTALTKARVAGTRHTRFLSLGTDEDAMSYRSNISEMQCSDITMSSCKSSQTDQSWNSDQCSTSENPRKSSVSGSKVDIDCELARLRIELRHLQGMYEFAQNESVNTSHQINELSARRIEEAVKLEEVRTREKKAQEVAQQEKKRREAAEREAEYVRERAEKEALQRKDVEKIIAHEADEKKRLEKALSCNGVQFRNYTWEEIESATSSFSDVFKIGLGANGTVYKGSLHHTSVAVKILHSNDCYRTKQFKRELEVLGRLRHPHLLLLLGACPDRRCLVYEYMENGSLADRLQSKDGTAPLPWFYRYRIAWEIASALAFLHYSKPEPIIHRDLKPENILLDGNFVSKVGDVGLSTILPSVDYSVYTSCKDTAPVGTFFYIDPEYQRTGLVSPQSDTYALGMVILELLTAKSPMGLAHIVENALQGSCLMDVLDSRAGQWPPEETQELAFLGLSCLEMRRKDRPDLKDQVLPWLERLKDFANNAHDLARQATSIPPSYFICPLLKRVMDDPCIASDGYTYNRNAIETWLRTNDKSPMTNLPLPNKDLIPNQTLLSAIKDRKSRTQ
ncbi:U-box domain-containing protein 52 isoform X2 [Phoenix dactylifera]|uniref:RING-type E3 ubiquitin transferase n=1 Tax=Phoenix dactylifera TaxID=42345 RepID=A0A8B8ZXZ3_PHODC|nr:U-box domain-containing protein 52 isoform X2 [Phoenix dactylifera]